MSSPVIPLRDLPGFAVLIRADGAIAGISEIGARHVGRPVDGLVGRPAAELLPEEWHGAWSTALGEARGGIVHRHLPFLSDGDEPVGLAVRLSGLPEGGWIVLGAEPPRPAVAADLASELERERLALDAAGLGLWEWHVATGQVTWSPQVMRLIGLTPSRFDGSFDTFLDQLADDDRQAVLVALQEALTGGQAGFHLQVRANRRSGQATWLDLRGNLDRDGQGRPHRLHGTLSDITSLKLAELALRESESRLALIFASISDLISLVQVRGDGGFTFLAGNRAYGDVLQRTGYAFPVDTLVGLDLETVLRDRLGLSPGIVAQHLAMNRAALSTQQVLRFTEAMVVPSGSIHLEMQLIAVRDRSGRPTHVLWTARDVSDRVTADALRSSEAELQQFFAVSTDVMFTIDIAIDGTPRYRLVNRRFSQVTGIVADRCLGRSPEEIFAAPLAANFSGHYRDCVAAGAPIAYEELVDLPEGIRWYHTSLAPVKDELGRVRRLIGLARDITDQRAKADATARTAAELERRIQERTAELAEADRQLVDFAATVSNDLRSPLRAIDGFSQILHTDHHEALDADGRGLVDRVRRNAKRLGRQIDDLLVLSRVARQPLVSQRVAVDVLAEGVIRQLRADEPERQVAIAIASDLWVTADPDLLRIAIAQLIRNAWKFTRDATSARISIDRDATEDGEAIRIRDNGAGFDPAYRHKLFQVFQRLHTPDQFEGSGIGLAIAHRVITRHGGRIWATAEVGRGATFWLVV